MLALSSQCGFITGDTGPIVSENAWWQCSTLVSWLNLRTHPRGSFGVLTWRIGESSSQRHSLAALRSQDILMVRRDLALHNGAKASIFSPTFAEVAELVDAHDSGSCGGHLVEVRVLSSALSSFDAL